MWNRVGSWRDAVREALVAGLVVLPVAQRRRVDRWLRGREEHRRLRAADVALVSYGKSGRTWLRVMLSRFYQVRYDLPATAMLEFDNLARLDPRVPTVLFTHGNYVRDYTGDYATKAPFHDKRVVLLVRDPRDIAVSQYFQWKYRMRPWKKVLNDYPPHGTDVSVFDFFMDPDAGLPKVLEFLDGWERELPKLRHVHVIRYEDMRADPAAALAGILAFLGTPGTPEEMAEAVAFGAYDNMKQLEAEGKLGFTGRRMRPGDSANPQSFKTRRAKVGGWRDYFDDAEIARIERWVEARGRLPFGYPVRTAAPAEITAPAA